MIILDTNVLSALTRPRPDQTVVDWLDRQPKLSVWTTAVTFFEMRAGIAMMPTGHRRATLEQIVGRVIDVVIERRVLAFDQLAADEAAGLAASRRRQGRPGEFRDTMIAGIAIARRASLATRNTRHFDDLPIPVVDPWAA